MYDHLEALVQICQLLKADKNSTILTFAPVVILEIALFCQGFHKFPSFIDYRKVKNLQ